MKYKIFQSDQDKQYYFLFQSDGGEVILNSQGYKKKSDCEKGVQAVLNNAGNAERFEAKQAEDGRFFFELSDASKKLLGTSILYKSPDEAESAIGKIFGMKGASEIVSSDDPNKTENVTPLATSTTSQTFMTGNLNSLSAEAYQKGKEYFFDLKKDGRVILQSQPYTSQAACQNGLESVMKNAGDESKYVWKKNAEGKHYFDLIAGNNQVIGTSIPFQAESTMKVAASWLLGRDFKAASKTTSTSGASSSGGDRPPVDIFMTGEANDLLIEAYRNNSDGEYYFHFKTKQGRPVLVSQGYASKESCENGIKSVIRNAANPKNFVRKTSPDGKHYFDLKASNGQIVGTSIAFDKIDQLDQMIMSLGGGGKLPGEAPEGDGRSGIGTAGTVLGGAGLVGGVINTLTTSGKEEIKQSQSDIEDAKEEIKKAKEEFDTEKININEEKMQRNQDEIERAKNEIEKTKLELKKSQELNIKESDVSKTKSDIESAKSEIEKAKEELRRAKEEALAAEEKRKKEAALRRKEDEERRKRELEEKKRKEELRLAEEKKRKAKLEKDRKEALLLEEKRKKEALERQRADELRLAEERKRKEAALKLQKAEEERKKAAIIAENKRVASTTTTNTSKTVASTTGKTTGGAAVGGGAAARPVVESGGGGGCLRRLWPLLLLLLLIPLIWWGLRGCSGCGGTGVGGGVKGTKAPVVKEEVTKNNTRNNVTTENADGASTGSTADADAAKKAEEARIKAEEERKKAEEERRKEEERKKAEAKKPLGPDAKALGFGANTMEGQMANYLSDPDSRAGKTFVMEKINWPKNSPRMNQAAYRSVANLKTLMQKYPNMKIDIVGHRETGEIENYNHKGEIIGLDEIRARCLYRKLKAKGISTSRMKWRGSPAGNDRRLEVIITEK